MNDQITTTNPSPAWFILNTQYCENYGAHDWDGTGECPQYWKNKGGSEYIIHASSAPHARIRWMQWREEKGYKDDHFSTEDVIDIQQGEGSPWDYTAEEQLQVEMEREMGGTKPYKPSNRDMLNPRCPGCGCELGPCANQSCVRPDRDEVFIDEDGLYA